MRPPFRYYGGKSHIGKQIVKYFPEHTTFVDVFGGAGNIILNKKPSKIDVWNDLNNDIYNFFKVLRDDKEELLRRLELTPYSRTEFIECLKPSDDPVERARRTFVRQMQGWSGYQDLTPGNWSYSVTKSTNGMSSESSGFISSVKNLEAVASRLRTIQIECLDGLECIKRYDTPDTLFYLDPPYAHESRNDLRAYTLEMTVEDHARLAELLSNIQGMAAISGYDCELYERIYEGWNKVSFDIVCGVMNRRETKSTMRTEVLWANYNLDRGQLSIEFS